MLDGGNDIRRIQRCVASRNSATEYIISIWGFQNFSSFTLRGLVRDEVVLVYRSSTF